MLFYSFVYSLVLMYLDPLRVYKKSSSSKSISTPITKFDGNNFTVGALGIDTSFIVTTPPYIEDGIWKMVVDDLLVMKKDTSNL